MDVMRIIIKPSPVSIPNTTNTLFHPSSIHPSSIHPSSIRPTKFKIGSLMVQQSGPLKYHTATTTRRLVPKLATSFKQNPTSTSFRCCCSKEETFVETITGSDTGAWKQFVPNLFIWMLFFGPIKGALSAISKLIRMGVVVFLALRVLNTKLRFGSKKAEPRNITFDELAGVDEPTVHEFQYIKSVLQRTSEFKKLKVALPHGILLYGAPGTGKTTLVHALAREARVSFFPISALDIAKGDVRLKSLFNEARAHSPSIVYIRDIDFIAQQEKDCESGSPLIQLHTEMEKCNKNECMVMVIVATSINENIDAAMMSCNLYFDKVHVRKPDEDGRRKIMVSHLKDVIREEDKEVICDIVVPQTPGLVWHDLEHLANLSRRFAAHRGDDHVTVDDVVQALERIKNVFSNLDKRMAEERMRKRVESIAFGSES